MYTSGEELYKLTINTNKRICDVVVENECILLEKPIGYVREKMKKNLAVMKESAEYALNREVKSISGLTGGDAVKVNSYRKDKKTISGDIINRAIARALSCSEVNASMGKIVAAPTAGSCGILPAAIITSAEVLKCDDEKMVDALFTASGIGQIIARNATIAGAEGGCQAECGAAAAMAAAAIVEMSGGTPEMAFHAASIAMKNVMGLVCDPIVGLVEAPCAMRNASGVVNAMISADLALSGIKSIIPFDEVVKAMYRVGKSLPESLRETALGGIAATPTALKLRKKVYGD